MNVDTSRNNVNFQAKIKFINKRDFMDKKFFPFVDCQKPTEPLRSSFIKVNDFWTGEIRTCTSGGLVDDSGVLGFHIFDCPENINKVGDSMAKIIDSKNGRNFSGLLIGAKDFSTRTDSIPLFNRVREVVERFVNPSVFKVHNNNFAESNIAYERDLDTWFVYTPLPNYPCYCQNEPFIASLESLLSAFREIKIAPQDSLFIGEKQIVKEDCPKIFYEG